MDKFRFILSITYLITETARSPRPPLQNTPKKWKIDTLISQQPLNNKF